MLLLELSWGPGEPLYGIECADGLEYDLLFIRGSGIHATYYFSEDGLVGVYHTVDIPSAVCEGRHVDSWRYGVIPDCPWWDYLW